LEGNQSAGYSFKVVVHGTAERPQKRPVGYEYSLTSRHLATLLTAVQRMIRFALFLHFLPPFPIAQREKAPSPSTHSSRNRFINCRFLQTISYGVHGQRKLGVAFDITLITLAS
jgi:hypothetical protein